MTLTTLQPLAYTITYITFTLGLASIFLRFYCRLFILKSWGWDDYIAVGILLSSIAQTTVLHMFLHNGCGLHFHTLSGFQQAEIAKWLFIEEIVYYIVHWTIKTAFLVFYHRLTPNKTFRGFVYLGMATNSAIFIINILLACFQCIPFDEILHPGTNPGAKCIPTIVLLIVPSVLNIVQDIYILVLPIATVLSLQMTTRRKIAVLSVMAFGGSAVVVAMFRLIPLLELNNSPDTSWALGKMVIVAALEIQLAVIAVNLPSLKALWIRATGGGSSGGTAQKKEGTKGYKLSSMGKDGTKMSSRKRARRGSLTMLERGITSTESEEELFRQAGMLGTGRDIKITTDVNISSTLK